MPDEELTAALTDLGAALGLHPADTEPAAAFARRCTARAGKLKAAAGITWSDYELIRADKGSAAFGLRRPPDSSPLGGPRWIIRLGEPLDELAGRLGLYEDTQP